MPKPVFTKSDDGMWRGKIGEEAITLCNYCNKTGCCNWEPHGKITGCGKFNESIRGFSR